MSEWFRDLFSGNVVEEEVPKTARFAVLSITTVSTIDHARSHTALVREAGDDPVSDVWRDFIEWYKGDEALFEFATLANYELIKRDEISSFCIYAQRRYV